MDRECLHEQSALLAKENALKQEDVEKICTIFRILSDPTRMKIVLALMQGGMCVYHLTEVVGGTVSGVSHQLRILRENNVVKAERLGKNIEYSIADTHIVEIVNMGITHSHCKKEAQGE